MLMLWTNKNHNKCGFSEGCQQHSCSDIHPFRLEFQNEYALHKQKWIRKCLREKIILISISTKFILQFSMSLLSVNNRLNAEKLKYPLYLLKDMEKHISCGQKQRVSDIATIKLLGNNSYWTAISLQSPTNKTYRIFDSISLFRYVEVLNFQFYNIFLLFFLLCLFQSIFLSSRIQFSCQF